MSEKPTPVEGAENKDTPRVVTEDTPTVKPKVYTSEPIKLPDGTITTREELTAPKPDPVEEKVAEGREKAEAASEVAPAASDPEPKLIDPRKARLDDLPKEVIERLARKRVSRITAQKYEAERKAAELEARLTELEAKAKAPAEEPKVELPPAPKPEDFSDYEDYLNAREERLLGILQATKAKEAAAPAPAPQPAPQPDIPPEVYEARDAFFADGKDLYPDFEETLTRPDLNFDREMSEFCFGDDHGVEVAYYLARKPEEAERIFRMNGPEKLAALGTLSHLIGSETLSIAPPRAPEASPAEPAPKPKPRLEQSKAPEPITPLRSGGAEGPPPSLDRLAKESPEAYRELRRKQQRAQGYS